MKVLTYNHLEGMDACAVGLRKFKKLFPKDMRVTLANVKKLAAWGWSGGKCVPTSQSCAVFFHWYARRLDLGVLLEKLYRIRSMFNQNKITYTQYINRASKIALAVLKKEKA